MLAKKKASFQAGIIAIGLAPILVSGGCAAVDQYSSRSVDYNSEAAKSRTKTTLLNIVRAAYRQPLQFTDISSVAGTASASGTVSAMVPVTTLASTISPGATFSGGPTFNVANLNTQEFYAGIESEIDNKTIKTFLDQGVEPTVLFPLVISDYTVSTKGKRFFVKTESRSVGEFKSFLSFTYRLLNQGLTIEKTNGSDQIGPSLSNKEAKQLLPNVLRASAEAQSGNHVPDLSLDKKTHKFNLAKDTGAYRFCFDALKAGDAKPIEESSSITSVSSRVPDGIPLILAIDDGRPVKGLSFKAPKKFVCGKSDEKKAGDVDLKVTTRSVESVIYFLGGISRLELGLETGQPASIQWSGRNGDFYLFNIKTGTPGPLDPSVEYAGQTYYVSVDPTGLDASTQVLQLLTDLQALESKASNLPAPVPISILAGGK